MPRTSASVMGTFIGDANPDSTGAWPTLACCRAPSARHRDGVEVDAAGRQLLAQPQEGEVLGLGLEHDVEVEAGGGLAEEVLEPDRVDEVGVRAQLRQHPRAL